MVTKSKQLLRTFSSLKERSSYSQDLTDRQHQCAAPKRHRSFVIIGPDANLFCCLGKTKSIEVFCAHIPQIPPPQNTSALFKEWHWLKFNLFFLSIQAFGDTDLLNPPDIFQYFHITNLKYLKMRAFHQ